MNSEENTFENPQDPIKPSFDSIGRSVADKWAIQLMAAELFRANRLTEVTAFLNMQLADLERNVATTLENELSVANDHRFNSPTTIQDCKERVVYLRDEMKAMHLASQEGDRTTLFGEPLLESR